MGKIKVLPDNIKHMIAAGEVIEGPFSVVKELVENSLDAGASKIEVEIFDSGMKKILIRDNGFGMSREDVALSIEEHATSKIQSIDSLTSIDTYGFRGEALSSIASVSDLSIFTRAHGEEMGSLLQAKNGNVSVTDFAGAVGTTIVVENLFFNFPARKKFLKSRRVEQRYVREVFLKMTLAAFKTAFSLDVDGKRIITLSPCEDRMERIAQVYGKSVADNLYYEKLTDLKVSISGYLSKPGFVRASRNLQFFYINGRPVDYKYLSFHLSRAYEAIVPRGKYPAGIIFLEIESSLIDVNIHPAKREVKIFDQSYIDSLVYSLAKKVLDRSHAVPSGVFDRDQVHHEVQGGRSFPQSGGEFPGTTPTAPSILPGRDIVYARRQSPPEIIHDRKNDYLFESSHATTNISETPVVELPNAENPFVIVGVLFDTYLMVQEGELLHIIDFHAAHERILFDRIMADDYENEIQNLIFPHTMTLPPEDFRILLENIDEFTKFGFVIDEFPENTVVIRGIPIVTRREDPGDIINDILDRIMKESHKHSVAEKFAASLACHSAKRAGDKLSSSDMEKLVEDVMSMKYELRCPHGRPYLYTMKKYDLERMFKR